MKTDDNLPENYELCKRIFNILIELGPSMTTMDLLAHRLSISKRTLYEIFGSKDEMLKTILESIQKKHSSDIQVIANHSANVMEALVNILVYHKEAMQNINAKFFRDMDERYRHLRGDYEKSSQKWAIQIDNAIKLGIRQGVFRKELNYDISIPMLRLQMESLKRMEDFFPPGITLSEAYNTIAISFLRSIATTQGMETIDKLTHKFK